MGSLFVDHFAEACVQHAIRAEQKHIWEARVARRWRWGRQTISDAVDIVLFVLLRIPFAAVRGVALFAHTVFALVIFITLTIMTIFMAWVFVSTMCAWAHASTCSLDPEDPTTTMLLYYILTFIQYCNVCRMLPNFELSLELWRDVHDYNPFK